jgi:hypothetical protein
LVHERYRSVVTALRNHLQDYIGLLGDFQPAAAAAGASQQGDEQVLQSLGGLDAAANTAGDGGGDDAATATAGAEDAANDTSAAALAAAAAAVAGFESDEDAPDWCAVTAAPSAGAAGEEPALEQLIDLYLQLQPTFDKAYAAYEDREQQLDAPRLPLLVSLLLSLQQLGQQLQEFGGAVCAALPVRFCCNNVQCLSLAGFSEQQQVAGRKNTCSGCKYARWVVAAQLQCCICMAAMTYSSMSRLTSAYLQWLSLAVSNDSARHRLVKLNTWHVIALVPGFGLSRIPAAAAAAACAGTAAGSARWPAGRCTSQPARGCRQQQQQQQ